ncbi:MAG: exo-alpha-sialidase [Bryobacterales bacterium]|nr:exo-alpha-sialidase [Bryobacterales bacterium]
MAPLTLSRRALLSAPAALAQTSASIRSEVFLPSPASGTAVMAYAFYTRPKGLEMLSIEQRWTRSDTVDAAFYRRSSDNGRTWSAPEPRVTGEKTPRGMLRRHPRAGFADPHTGRFLDFWTEGVLPNDDPLEGLRQWNIFYRISRDGGRTFGPPVQVIHTGGEFNATHPMPGVHTGRNCIMTGDNTCVPLAAPGGRLLLPVQLSIAAPDGSLYNPGGGYTWTEAAVLHGRWRKDRLEWRLSSRVSATPETTTRGMVEPTLAFLEGGRLMMVLRGSNDHKPELPSYKWISTSDDGGFTWSSPAPWTYDDGAHFFSPSACSQLLKHSSGRLFWLGNIAGENPHGNRPRYPFVIGELDRRSGLLRRSTVRTVDTLQPGESDQLSLSNFYAREDRATREICLHMTRLFALPSGWQGDGLLYRIPV